jgi:hypothetical protein
MSLRHVAPDRKHVTPAGGGNKIAPTDRLGVRFRHSITARGRTSPMIDSYRHPY